MDGDAPEESQHDEDSGPNVAKGNDIALHDARATFFRPWRFGSAPVRAFHGAWATLFIGIFASFSPAALTVPIRDTLNLDESDIALGNALTIGGTALCRVLLGSLCDAFGPKSVTLTMLLATGLPLYFITLVDGPAGKRVLLMTYLGDNVALSLYWCSSMFADDIVGTATSTMLGLGEAGFGIAQLVLPALFVLFSKTFEPFVAWRATLLIPGVLQLMVFAYVLVATQDRPGGGQRTPLLRSKRERGARKRWMLAIKNYRTWVFMLLDGIVLGFGLSIYNIITSYYFDNFDISLAKAGVLGSLTGFGCSLYMPVGGSLSDLVARHKGMRGRLWVAAGTMVATGIALILLAEAHRSLVLSVISMQLVVLLMAMYAAALFSLTPFVSHRSLGLVQGIVGSGSNIFGAILQELLFNASRMETHKGFFWAGITILASTVLLLTIYYPMWGGLLWKPAPNAQAIQYYLAEYTEEEIQMGLAERSIRFAQAAMDEHCPG